ncbi:DUF4326 domain-containing protein [soil metagenome]
MIRIQRKRERSWRMPAGAVYVGRPSKWGNPYLLTDVGRRFPSLTVEQCAGFVVNEFRDLVRAGTITDSLPSERPGGPREVRTVTYPSVEEIRAELAGATALVCWCPLDQPCHADVLIELLEASA